MPDAQESADIRMISEVTEAIGDSAYSLFAKLPNPAEPHAEDDVPTLQANLACTRLKLELVEARVQELERALVELRAQRAKWLRCHRRH